MSEIEDTLWREEWKGMPEFVQEKKEPYAKIIVRIETKEDLEKFAELTGQKLTKKTKSIWFPEVKRGLTAHKRWQDSDAS